MDEDDLLPEDDLLGEAEEEWVEVGEEGAPGFRAALFSSQAARYAAFRPRYPEKVGLRCPCSPCMVATHSGFFRGSRFGRCLQLAVRVTPPAVVCLLS